MDIEWFSPHRYKHFDRPVCEKFAAKVTHPDFVKSHAFSPLIHYLKEEPRYKFDRAAGKRISTVKPRPIKYAAHRDACIFSYYASMLSQALERFYAVEQISESVAAYRSLGKANYDFAAEALAFAKKNSPVIVLAFDVKGFFDNLNHALLKSRLKRMLSVSDLGDDWFKVFRHVTQFRYVELDKLKAHVVFGERLKESGSDPIATVAELKNAGIKFQSNPTPGKGIPQGTPISAAMSNLYMVDFDVAITEFCGKRGAFYCRYSDDILVICEPEDAESMEHEVARLMEFERLQLSVDKTERTRFDGSDAGTAAQYLGFRLSANGASVRESSLSRQWRKMRRAMKRARKIAEIEIAEGRADRVWTKKLRRRFTSLPTRNFSSYARRSATAFGGAKKIKKQLRRLERAAEAELDALKRELHPDPD